MDRHPNQIFILDHVAKPRIRERILRPWQPNIRELALRPNVYCKLSGMGTEADWRTWSDEALAPYIETVLEAFTPKRMMFGSDWPVVTLASSYRRWIDTVRGAIAQLSPKSEHGSSQKRQPKPTVSQRRSSKRPPHPDSKEWRQCRIYRRCLLCICPYRKSHARMESATWIK